MNPDHFSSRFLFSPAVIFLTLNSLLSALTPLSASFLPDDPFSNDAAGTTGAAFLKIPVGARAEAMGETYVAVAGGADSLFWNPAGLFQPIEPQRPELSLSYNSLLETSYSSAFSYVRRMKNREDTVWAAGMIFNSQSSLQGFNEFGDTTGSFTPNDLALSFAAARSFDEKFSFGAAVKGIRQQLAGETAVAFALDFGILLYHAFDLGEAPVDVGASLQNLGPGISLGSAKDPLPLQLRVGGVWWTTPDFNMLMDVHFPVDQAPYLSLGGEWRAYSKDDFTAAIRGGFNMKNIRDIDGIAGFTAGFGAGLKNFRLDYAWVPFGDLGHTHRFTFNWRFAQKEEPSKPKKKIKKTPEPPGGPIY